MKADDEQHPSFGMIAAYRGSYGATLFDSDIYHHHTVTLRIHRASRRRELHSDWIHAREELIEVEMSEAQYASFVSSPNTSGVPCTIRTIQGEDIERPVFAPRLEESMRETHEAAQEAFGEIVEALRVFEETPSTPARAKKEALASLRAKIQNAVPNVDFAGKRLSEHAENVVQKARSDVEAMVSQHAARMGVEALPAVALLEASERKGG